MTGAAPVLPVLLAGEDAAYLRALRALLSDAGLVAHASTDLAAVPRLAARLGAGAVVLDFGVAHPERAGLALVALRHHPATAARPVIATAAATWLLTERAALLSSHPVWVWTDSSDLAGLLRRVETVLGQPASSPPSMDAGAVGTRE